MSYEYWQASLPIRKSPDVKYKDDWEHFTKRQFRNAYNWFDIEEEVGFGTQEYKTYKVRTTYVLIPGTGTKLSDDWRTVIFNVGHKCKMGRRYRYFDNIWLTVNTEEYGTPTDNCIIRRCNSFITMKDKYGNIHKEPCAIDPNLKYGNVYYNNSVNIAQGTVKVWMQLNDYTKNIEINNRFILGYSEVYKVISIVNYMSDNTFDSYGCPLLEVEMKVDTKQIGDYFEESYSGSELTVETNSEINFIGITPQEYNIPQGEKITYTCNYFNGDIASNHEFNFVLMDNNIPKERYSYDVIDGNTFSIQNYKKYVKENIQIKCIDLTNQTERVFTFNLGGEI